MQINCGYCGGLRRVLQYGQSLVFCGGCGMPRDKCEARAAYNTAREAWYVRERGRQECPMDTPVKTPDGFTEVGE